VEQIIGGGLGRRYLEGEVSFIFSNLHSQLKSLSTKLQELERTNAILSHKLADQEAATELEMNKRAKLEQETEKLEAENGALRKQQELWSTQFRALHGYTMNVEKALSQSLGNFNKVVSKLTSFDQRMRFASSRIQFISGIN
jgi:chromosome segregation ATPase